MAEHREYVSAEIKAFGEYAYRLERERLTIEGVPKRGQQGWERFRGCTRKVRFHEPPIDLAGWLSAYRCNWCEGYHVTSKQKKWSAKLLITCETAQNS